MAKAKEATQTFRPNTVYYLKPGQIGWHPDLNSRKDYGDKKVNDNTTNSLALRGWDKRQIVHGFLPNGPNEVWADRIVELREKEWVARKEAAKRGGRHGTELAVFVHDYVEDGQIIRPVVLANMAFRRGSLLHNANMLRATQDEREPDTFAEGTVAGVIADSVMPTDQITDIPVEVMFYADEYERLADQTDENTLEDENTRKPFTEQEKLAICYKFVQYNANENVLRKHFPVGTAQKNYAICVVDGSFPEVGLIKGLLEPQYEMVADEKGNLSVKIGDDKKPVPNPKHIPYGPIPRGSIQSMARSIKTGELYKPDKLADKMERASVQLSASLVKQFINEWVGDKAGPEDKSIIKRADAQGLQQNNANMYTKCVASYVLSKSTADLRRPNEDTDILNLVWFLVADGYRKDVHQALLQLRERVDAELAAEAVEVIEETEAKAPAPSKKSKK